MRQVKNKIELFKNNKSSKICKIVMATLLLKNTCRTEVGRVIIKNSIVITNNDIILFLFFIILFVRYFALLMLKIFLNSNTLKNIMTTNGTILYSIV